jgi:2-haloacid dehalogenase
VAHYRSPSTHRRVRAILFDVFGTVVDWRSGISAAVQSFARRHDISIDAAQFATAWRAQYQPSMEPIRAGARQYVTLDTLHRENLEIVLRTHGINVGDLGEDELQALAKSWRYLPPWPDSVPGIGALKSHFIVGPLSNANTALLVDMAKFGGLPWDVVLGSDVGRAYKPDVAAYRTPARFLGIDVGEVMLVAAHNGDLEFAQRAGLGTAFVARPLEHGPGQTVDVNATGQWDASVASITELADQLDAGAAGDDS